MANARWLQASSQSKPTSLTEVKDHWTRNAVRPLAQNGQCLNEKIVVCFGKVVLS